MDERIKHIGDEPYDTIVIGKEAFAKLKASVSDKKWYEYGRVIRLEGIEFSADQIVFSHFVIK